MKNIPIHIMVSQDFFPCIGGAHSFLYEVYKRWKSGVISIVQDYKDDSELGLLQEKFDRKLHGALKIKRKDIYLKDINLLNNVIRGKVKRMLIMIQDLSKDRTVYLHTIRAYPEGFLGLIYKILKPNKTVLITYAHGEEVLYCKSSRQIKYATKLVYRFADLIIANSHSSKHLVKTISRPKKIEIVHPGVEFDKYQVDKESVLKKRKEWAFNGDDIIICSISRISKRKNHISVLKAILACQKLGFRIKYVIGSEGSEKEVLIKFVKDNNLTDSVIFLGFLNEKDKVLTLCASDIHIMPAIEDQYTTEGFGIVFIEAAAAGLPSISGNVGGQTESVNDGYSGFTVDGDNLKSVTEALQKLSGNKELRARMGKNARKWAKQFDWDFVNERIEKIVYRH